MKNKFFLSVVFLVTLLFSAFSGNAQQTKKVIVVVNKAGWCPVCQANGEKIMKEVIPAFNESNVMFIMNDLTNDAAKSDSKMKLDEAKVYDAVKRLTQPACYCWLILKLESCWKKSA
jgi:spermidine/putrescine-binding protein